MRVAELEDFICFGYWLSSKKATTILCMVLYYLTFRNFIYLINNIRIIKMYLNKPLAVQKCINFAYFDNYLLLQAMFWNRILEKVRRRHASAILFYNQTEKNVLNVVESQFSEKKIELIFSCTKYLTDFINFIIREPNIKFYNRKMKFLIINLKTADIFDHKFVKTYFQ